MRRFLSMLALGSAAVLALPPAAQAEPAQAAAGRINIETRAFTLPNGLKVVMSRDALAPTATVGVYYGIGFRVEPRNRTGFAHLFEHLMFQGSANAPKGQFIGSINNAGGVLNGSTRFDFTNYYEVVPSNALEQILWLEADRMARPIINDEVLKNQQGVVANEVKVNVLNQPYGGWPWIDLPMLANTNWYNAHNFYGELAELEAATVTDATDFFGKYYRPNNAVLVVAGDIDYDRTRAMVERLFGSIPGGEPVVLPDISEPRQTEAKLRIRKDPLAPRPGFSAGYHMPPRGTPEWYAMGLIDQMLLQGDDSRLHRKLVQEEGITGSVDGGINLLGNMFNYRGPMLWSLYFQHDPTHSRDAVTSAVDAVIEDLRTRPVAQADLDRARVKMRSSIYDLLASNTRFNLVDMIAAHTLFDNDPTAVNRMEEGFSKVTPALVLATAKEYLRPTNRSIVAVEPAAATAPQTGASQ